MWIRPDDAPSNGNACNRPREVPNAGRKARVLRCYIDVAAEKLSILAEEKKFVAAHKPTRVSRADAGKLIEDLREFRREHWRSFSLSLHLNMQFLEDYATAYPDAFLALVLGRTVPGAR